MSLAWSTLLAALAGSLHCAGMCGPFAAHVAGNRRARGPLVAYHAGRLVTYAAVGWLAGWLGRAVDGAGAWAGVADAAAIAAAIALVAGGLVTLGRHFGWLRQVDPRAARRRLAMPATLWRLARRLRRIDTPRATWASAAIVGIATPLLPCGWLYAFVALAASTGAPLPAAAVLVALWAGSLPALLLVDWTARAGLGRLRRHAPVAMAIVLMVAGLATIAWRLAPRPAPPGAHTTCHHEAPAPRP